MLIARSDAGELPVRRERVPAAEVLERRREALRQDRRGERAGSSTSSPPDGILLDADPARLEQALGNLVDNALVHGAGRIVLSAEPRGDLVALHVRGRGGRLSR